MSSWFSRSTLAPLRYNRFNLPAVGPTPFNPSLDVSGLAFWLDANDSSTLDISGTDVLRWTEKLKGVDVYNTSDLSNCPQYGVHFFNELNVVYFPLNAVMVDSETVLDFNDRTCFVVAKPLAFQVDLDISGSAFLNFYHGDATADMSLGLRWYDLSGYTQYALCQNGILCGVQFDICENPLKTKMILAWRQSSSDLSGNAGWYDTISQTLANSQLSTFNPDGQYKLSDDTKNQSVDIAEILIYDSVLSDSDVVEVLDYLAAKWGAARPPKPKPVPPTPVPPIPLPS